MGQNCISAADVWYARTPQLEPKRFSMQIQINAPHSKSPEEFNDYIEQRITEVLQPFAAHLTRVEVHMKDLNGAKGGSDKRCLMEARPRGLDPVAVEAVAEDETDAVRQSLEKLKHALEHRFGKLGSRRS